MPPLVPPKPPAPRKTTRTAKSAIPGKRPVAKRKVTKKKKPLAMEWKIAIAGLLLVLLSPFYYGYVIKGFTSTWRWIKDWGQDPNYRTYSSFDIRIPKKYSIHGIDVSYYQGKIDWKKVKAMKEDEVQVKFAFIKATEGILSVDPYFQRNWREAAKAGIICGAYHFFRPQKSGEWQAKFFLQTVKFEEGDLPPVVDIEQLNGVAPADMRKELQEFISYVEKRTKVKPMIYSGLTFYKDYLKGHFDEYPLWIAHYHQAKLKVGSDTNWSFWQHSDKARITGINHVVDFNAFNGDSTAFERLRIPRILSY
jgi:lysozyme